MIFPWDVPGGLIGWYAKRYGLTSAQAAYFIRHPAMRRYFEKAVSYGVG